MSLKTKEIWFIVGSQFLYGPKVLETVAARGQEMAQFIDAQKQIPCRFIYKGTVKTADEIEQLAKEANYSRITSYNVCYTKLLRATVSSTFGP